LATEQQFYLLWPVLLLTAVRRGRLRTFFITATVIALVASSLTTLRHWADPTILYKWPTSWALTLILGSPDFVYKRAVGQSAVVSPAAVLTCSVVLGWLCIPQMKAEPSTYLFGALVVGVCSSIVIVWAARFPHLPPLLRPFQWVGRVSYAAYLWNYPLVIWLGPYMVGFTGLQRVAVTIPATLLAAQLSWVLIEEPVSRYRRRLDNSSKAQARQSVGVQSDV
jgi:peptidoglycan/LPS O-acetylase OafA/YrhL